MPYSHPAVLVINSIDHFEQFHENLCETLRELCCRLTVAKDWADARAQLDEDLKDCRLIIVDPALEAIDESYLVSRLSTLPENGRPKIVTVQMLPDFFPSDFEEKIRPDAIVAKTYTPHELTFVFNRFLYPESLNKRRHRRALASLSVEVGETQNDRRIRSETFNLSAGGAFIRSYSPPRTNVNVEMRIELPDGSAPVECVGKVVFSRAYSLGEHRLLPPGMGVEFNPLSEEVRKRIAEYVNYRLQMTEPNARRE